MKTDQTRLSTGLPGLDRVLLGLLPGDNVVWRLDDIEDYLPVLLPFWAEAGRNGRRLTYFRFARHKALLSESCGADVYRLDPQEGFERFLAEILNVIEKAGPGAYYVFDCLSDLAADWYSDQMLGNFFMIVCPYLYELDTVAYFALLKNQHSSVATDAISRTAQVVIEVFRQGQRRFLHPLKVYERHTPTLYTIHSWEGEEFRPVTNSATITDILAGVPQPWLDFTIHRPGVWTRIFYEAQQALHARPPAAPLDQATQRLCQRLLRMVITREDRLLGLATTYFELADLVGIMKRMIGTGRVGGKSLGMLLARAILRKADPAWAERLESHDSFFVGSDVFYTFLVQNGCWWLRRRHKDFDVYLARAAEARERILKGTFPPSIQHQFMEMLDYFGQSPIIVRSSSLLEDSYGKAFSGKYESVFCANQGTPQERLEAFMAAVRTVYASTMHAEGLQYRRHHGLLERDEQMALLVQRVSGERYGDLFFPHTGGVGFSFNPFVWHEEIDPTAGFLRLVFGLGTRAVERTGDDYTRLLSLNAPLKRPEVTPDQVTEYSQRRVDLLDLQANRLVSRGFDEVATAFPVGLLSLFASVSAAAPDLSSRAGGDGFTGSTLTFDRLVRETKFVPVMRELLQVLQEAYQHPVDVEFTAHFEANGEFRLNLVQCRPFQVKIRGEGSRIEPPPALDPAHLLFSSSGPIVGHSLATLIDRLIYIVPSVYSQLTRSEQYSVARTIGRLTHLEPEDQHQITLLIGPGRWGTSMPSLGVPVSFAEINRVQVICELALMHEGLVPDVSLGTHFFNDLVEMDMLYLAVAPHQTDHTLNEAGIRQHPNQLPALLPNSAEWARVIHVIDSHALAPAGAIHLNVDSMKQRAVCYWASAT
ncbi:MAG: pyruvate, phosphate dikinase [Verrucomicrobia bacterium]|nr:pyruvate, phosphate dikinase [Verrucomicrobiota bacterium]